MSLFPAAMAITDATRRSAARFVRLALIVAMPAALLCLAPADAEARAHKAGVKKTSVAKKPGATRTAARGGKKAGKRGTARMAPEASIQGQLAKLAPETRMEQRCNARAMNAVQSDHKDMRPDRLVAYAFGEPDIKDGLLKAQGAAVRSGSSWFRMTYTCQTADDGMSVKAFEYKLGETVPRKDWDDHLLVPP